MHGEWTTRTHLRRPSSARLAGSMDGCDRRCASAAEFGEGYRRAGRDRRRSEHRAQGRPSKGAPGPSCPWPKVELTYRYHGHAWRRRHAPSIIHRRVASGRGVRPTWPARGNAKDPLPARASFALAVERLTERGLLSLCGDVFVRNTEYILSRIYKISIKQ